MSNVFLAGILCTRDTCLEGKLHSERREYLEGLSTVKFLVPKETKRASKETLEV